MTALYQIDREAMAAKFVKIAEREVSFFCRNASEIDPDAATDVAIDAVLRLLNNCDGVNALEALAKRSVREMLNRAKSRGKLNSANLRTGISFAEDEDFEDNRSSAEIENDEMEEHLRYHLNAAEMELLERNYEGSKMDDAERKRLQRLREKIQKLLNAE